MEYPYLYDMDKEELLNYLKDNLDFRDDTYPYLNHDEVLNMDEEQLRKLIVELEEENTCCTIIREG